jgi:aryl-alcohol dehydrogenase-like predicted oxidoreductase
LLKGAYASPDVPLPDPFDHPGTRERLAALAEVVRQTGATPNQVVLSWLMGGEVPAVPVVGSTTLAQLDESLEAVDLELTPGQRALLDGNREQVG